MERVPGDGLNKVYTTVNASMGEVLGVRNGATRDALILVRGLCDRMGDAGLKEASVDVVYPDGVSITIRVRR